MADIDGNVTDPRILKEILNSIHTDLTNLKSAVDAIATKLNSDGGVTDTDYAGASTLETTT